MQIVHIRFTVFNYALRKRKKEEKDRTKLKFSCSISSPVRRINGTIVVYFTLEYLKVFIYSSFASLCCVYVRAAPIPSVQDNIFNLANPYLRSTIVLLDTFVMDRL